VRPGEALEQQYGYLPADGTYGCCNAHGVVATLLEDDTADLALSQFAASQGDRKDSLMLQQRANNWENMFDPDNDLLNPRDEDGQFVPGVVPLSEESGEPYYVEGDAYEYLWDTPNDYPALFSLLGGDSAVIPALTQYLSKPNGYGMNAELSNEFDLGEQYALDYAGDPAGTQQAVNTIRNTMYLPGPSGLANNDDLGAESSQFIFEMLGLYPENSGSGTLVFNTPGFPHASVSLPNGHAITINAPGASPTEFYADSLTINGQPDNRLYTTYDALSRGATLDWTLGTSPTSWGSAPQDAPPSYTAGLRPVVGYTSGQATLAPGGSTTVQVEAQNATRVPQRVQAKVSVPSGSGLTITPSAGSFLVPASGTGSLTLTVTASSSAPQTFSTVPIVNLTVLVAPAGIFSIGTYDHSDAEFALAPAGYESYLTDFPNDVNYAIGTSAPGQDWPYIQPGPDDAWAGNRVHPFTISYSLPAAPATNPELVIYYLDTQNKVPPAVTVLSNGTSVGTVQTIPGGGNGFLTEPPLVYSSVAVVIPATTLQAGANTLTIENTSGSWSVYDAVELLPGELVPPTPSA